MFFISVIFFFFFFFFFFRLFLFVCAVPAETVAPATVVVALGGVPVISNVTKFLGRVGPCNDPVLRDKRER
jgi:hypothetical protein